MNFREMYLMKNNIADNALFESIKRLKEDALNIDDDDCIDSIIRRESERKTGLVPNSFGIQGFKSPLGTSELNKEGIEMSESQSRYSIIENLTREKNACEQAIRAAYKSVSERKFNLKRVQEELEFFEKDALAEVELQKSKIAQLEAAVASITAISKATEKTE